jgi:hypothetical protein
LSVVPDWYLPEGAPDETTIPWETGAWSQDTYDKSLVGENQPGLLGVYHPVIHYMTKKEFEALGDNLTPKDIPEWTFKTKGLILILRYFIFPIVSTLKVKMIFKLRVTKL